MNQNSERTATVEELLVEIRDEVHGLHEEFSDFGRDAPIVNRLTKIIELLEMLNGIKEELEEEQGPRMY